MGNGSYKLPIHKGGGALAMNIREEETCSRASVNGEEA